jgi:5-carboxyvanillate decarboxylase
MTHALKTGGDRGYLRIATEEAFATREQIDVYLRMVNPLRPSAS